jgi:hypothetical protein
MNVAKTGVPDGSQEQAKVTRPKEIKIRGESGPMNAAPTYSETVVESGAEPMSDKLRKGAFGMPIAGAAPTILPEKSGSVPLEGGEQSAEKYGLARGKFGVNDER